MNQPHCVFVLSSIMFVLYLLVFVRLVDSHHKPCRVLILLLALLLKLIIIIIQIRCD